MLFAGWWITLALLLCRLVDLQVFQAQGLQRLAIRQQLGSLRLPGRRGAIVDRTGRPLALNVPIDSLYAVPRAIPDPAAFARARWKYAPRRSHRPSGRGGACRIAIGESGSAAICPTRGGCRPRRVTARRSMRSGARREETMAWRRSCSDSRTAISWLSW
ncbi:MAG: hypothetical protein E6H03_03380 [Bacillati bacterium ANGP1]|uniref:Penicillin-binding protein dimerisation domain-containing protein n=1 Tax=Candidatus Segetimicrobium genomatis TaxID=2569760 RepID=A0A537JJB5_9BACT|nr:MAG: hypothetical protein E6H03_03380 [Terrabacteria group bacterium ANGP1]